MKFSLTCLKEFYPEPITPQEIEEVLTSLGIEVESVSEDHIFDVALTPNLAHASSLLGIARELAAAKKGKWVLPSFAVKESDSKIESLVQVTLDAEDAVPRYAARLITDVRVGESPSWLAKRLIDAGYRPVNNVVDCTNYVLLELGYPLHAFDFDTIEGGRVTVRHARSGEKITTIDGAVHFPTTETLVIGDASRPLALAGIMGGKESEVSFSTKRVFLEAGLFDPVSIRRSAKRMNIHSEASRHFERGVDPEALLFALDRAASLIAEIAGGKVMRGTIDLGKKEFPKTRIQVRLSKINTLLGREFSAGEVEDIYSSLGLNFKTIKEGVLEVEVPSFRGDLKDEVDLIDEVARLYGLKNLYQKGRTAVYRASSVSSNPLYLFERACRNVALREGLQELLTSNLISPLDADLVESGTIPQRLHVAVLNPASQEESVLRPSLLPGLLKVVKKNRDHQIASISGFEIGKTHFKIKEGYLEPLVLGIVMAGHRGPHYWGEKDEEVTFFDLKGVLENILEALSIPNVTFEASAFHNFHPGRQAKILASGQELGSFGEIHPATLKKVGLEGSILFAELSIEDLLHYHKKDKKMEPLALYPGSYRDWTVTVPNGFLVGDLLNLISKEGGNLLEEVSLIDVYESETLGLGVKNLTLRFFYRDREKTLAFAGVEEEHIRITQHVLKQIKEQKR